MTSAEIQRQFAPVVDSVPEEARHLLDGLEKMVSARKLEHLRLLVSELMTNAVRHAGLTEGEHIRLRVVVEDRLTRVEVQDGGPGFEKRPSEPPPGTDRRAGAVPGGDVVGSLGRRARRPGVRVVRDHRRRRVDPGRERVWQTIRGHRPG